MYICIYVCVMCVLSIIPLLYHSHSSFYTILWWNDSRRNYIVTIPHTLDLSGWISFVHFTFHITSTSSLDNILSVDLGLFFQKDLEKDLERNNTCYCLEQTNTNLHIFICFYTYSELVRLLNYKTTSTWPLFYFFFSPVHHCEVLESSQLEFEGITSHKCTCKLRFFQTPHQILYIYTRRSRNRICAK